MIKVDVSHEGVISKTILLRRNNQQEKKPKLLVPFRPFMAGDSSATSIV